MDSLDLSSQTLTPCSKRLCTETESTEASDDFNKRAWSDLPPELLEQIAVRLAFIELLSFRSTCKSWRFASSKVSGESHDVSTIWYLLYGNDPNCLLFDPSSGKMYNINFPEMYGADCIASSAGWLLLYRNRSMFFFCPFSRAKIDLPKFPNEVLLDPIATFSSTPTSPDCIVCVGNKISRTCRLELNVLRRGDSEWVRYESSHFKLLRNILTGAGLSNAIVYFLDSVTFGGLSFNLQDEKWIVYVAAKTGSKGFKIRQPFRSIRNKCKSSGTIEKISESIKEDNFSLITCGAYIQGSNTCIHNEREELKISHIKKKGVWIQPRIFQLLDHANLTWSL